MNVSATAPALLYHLHPCRRSDPANDIRINEKDRQQ